MAQFAPINYGPEESTDLSGNQMAQAAAEAHGRQLFGALRNFADEGTKLSGTLLQTTLHRQSAEATAKVAESHEKAIRAIEDNPYYMTKGTLAQHITDPNEVDKIWNRARTNGNITTDKDGNEFAATFAVGHDFYDAYNKQETAKAAAGIMMPGWRSEFLKAATVEAANKKEHYLDPKLGRYKEDFDQARSLESWDTQAKAARTPQEFAAIFASVRGSPSFNPKAKEALLIHYGERADTSTAYKSLLNPMANYDDLKSQQAQLQGPQAKQLYPHLDDKGRLELERQVTAGLHFADAQQAHANEMQKKADTANDEQLNATVMRSVLNGKLNPSNLWAQPGQPGTGAADQLLAALKTREGVDHFYHFVESYNKAQAAGDKDDKPGVMQAMANLYAHDIEGFRKLMESKNGGVIPGWENLGTVNPAEDMPKSFKYWAEKYTGLADKEASKEDAANSARMQVRIGAAMTNDDGGRVKPSDYMDTTWRAEHSDFQAFVEGQLAQANAASIKRSGHRLTVPEEDKTLLLAAKSYADNPTPGILYGRNEGEGTGFELSSGEVQKLGALERTYMLEGRAGVGMVGTPDIQKEAGDFYDNFKPRIEKEWKNVFGKAPDLEDQWNVYYIAKTVNSNDTQLQTLKAIQTVAKQLNAKKNGGTK